jgi:hypothetical protein
VISSDEQQVGRNPYAPPTSPIDEATASRFYSPWGRSAAFYWAFLWRAMLLFVGFSVPFYVIYGLIKLLLDQWPLLERLIRLVAVLGLMGLAMSFAIQWAAKSRFGNFLLRAVPNREGPKTTGASSELTLGRAARVTASHLWRFALVVAPVNVALMELLLGHILPAELTWRVRIEEYAVTWPPGIVIGVWAMREALSLSYRDFHLQWFTVEEASTSLPIESASSGPPTV